MRLIERKVSLSAVIENTEVAALNDVKGPILTAPASEFVSLRERSALAKLKAKRKIDWVASTFIVAVHIIAAFAAFFTFSWKALLVMVVLHWITGGLGITLAYHRLLTHRSFKTPKIIEYLLSIIGCLACQGGPLSWVTAHRLHHAYSDEEGDPHSPLDGFMWAHMSWCMHDNSAISTLEGKKRVSPDLYNDPVHRMLDNGHIVWTLMLAAGLYALGGWPFVIWGIFVRLVLVYHCTWLVNSAAHVWGYRTYATTDRSTNLWWVALLTYGEGWHNNHHAFQFSARHGLEWWELDTTYWMIKFLEYFGLASAVKLPSKYLLDTTYARNQKNPS